MGFIQNLLFNMDVTTCLVFAIVFLLVYLFCLSLKKAELPPAPFYRLPIIRHLPLLAYGCRLVTFNSLRKKYGDLYRLEIGSTTVIVINGYRLLHEAFIKNSGTFSDRPHTIFLKLCKDNGILLNNGEKWKEQRKFVLKNIRHFATRTKILETTIHKHVSQFHDRLCSMTNAAIDPKQLFTDTVSSIVGEIMFGEALDSNGFDFRKYVEQQNGLVDDTCRAVILDYLPFLQYIPFDWFGHDKVLDGFYKTSNFMKDKIALRSTLAMKGSRASDMTEAYLRHETGFDEDQIIHVVGDLFAAGLETTVTTLRWALIHLTQHPDIQARLHQEIDQVLLEDRLPSYADKKALPYTEAFVMEILRISNPAPIGLPHFATCDCYLDGFLIPKGATIIPNLDSVLKDPTYFENPDDFKPERFLNKEGKVFKPETFIPFSFGKRVCLGEQIARMNIFIFLTSLLQNYSVNRLEGDTRPIKGVLNITYCPDDFEICFQKRNVTRVHSNTNISI